MELDFSLSTAFGIDPEALDFDLAGFVPASRATDGIESERHLLPRIYEGTASEPVLYEHAIDLVDGLTLQPGMRMFCLVSGNFVFGDILEAMAERGIAEYRTMTIQTLSMSQENIDSLRNVVERCFELERLRIVLSDYFYAHERKATGLVPYLYESLDVDDILDVAFASVHTKIVTFETVDGLKAVVDGSANLRSSRNIEQFRIECDANLHDSIEAFADRIFEAYSTINKDVKSPKSVRGGRLWDAVKEV
ncbi:MAG: hypothetical protein IJ781_06715 [Atopobiaceae bacterium]|nr:hypothetical protein [Atopobiaceae bacterium]